MVHEAARHLGGAGDVAPFSLDGGRGRGHAAVELHGLRRHAVAPGDEVQVLRAHLDHDQRRDQAEAAHGPRDEVGGLRVHGAGAADAVVGPLQVLALVRRAAGHEDGLLAVDGALVGRVPDVGEVAGGEEVAPLGNQHQRVRDPSLAVRQHPPAVREAERQVLRHGATVLHLVEDDVPAWSQQRVTGRHGRCQVHRGVDHVRG
mmetsp:Transcript_6509/g.20237  ORF Transcript_6509/g.20237 Transcript_6509/m.20237 type:complete len:203 (+) Transcript_6509:921-1529(+)